MAETLAQSTIFTLSGSLLERLTVPGISSHQCRFGCAWQMLFSMAQSTLMEATFNPVCLQILSHPR